MVDAFVSQRLTTKHATIRLPTSSRLFATISKEELKVQLTEYLNKRKEVNADELAKQYVDRLFTCLDSNEAFSMYRYQCSLEHQGVVCLILTFSR